MKKDDEKALDLFLDEEEDAKNEQKDAKKVIMAEKEGLIERVDKIFVTQDGKQLLREQY